MPEARGDDPAGRDWDVIVIGTGMGGGLAGRRLAERGLSVLFLERGPLGPRGEEHRLDPEMRDPVARRVRGFWPAPIAAELDGRALELLGTVGAGVGGTSVFYAASLERPERHDLEDAAERAHPTGGWPVGHDAFRPHYERAERLLEVCGEPDPLSEEPAPRLRPAPPASEGDAAMMESFRAAGLNPYRMHLGIRYLPGCRECTGHKCPRACKMDGRSAGVEPALATGRAALLETCEATALRGGPGRIDHLEAVRGGERIRLRARRYLLAGGALGSARLLLASACEAWPRGCANGSGLVGRNLMFHLNELVAVWPERPADFTGPAKTIALRDLYHRDGMRLGLVQSLGISASYGNILAFLAERFDRSALAGLRPLREALRLPALAAARVFGDARVLVGILEDLPYETNRVTLEDADPERMRIDYAFAEELLARRRAFRRLIGRAFARHRRFFLNSEPALNLGHPCGTLRFGTDPARSVLDPSCRAHGIDNLYVADASFMPSSTGVNPSLTIAANALRTADRLVEELGHDAATLPAAAGRAAP
jgi:choline dehydrogenase-like flavoprotein